MKKLDMFELHMSEKDKQMIEWLVSEKKFSRKAALRCLLIFKQTMSFAGIKLASLVATIVLTINVAVAATYKLSNVYHNTYDVTTMTNTVNAWKYMGGNPVCAAKSLTFGALDNSVSCIGTDGVPIRFDMHKKSWIRHPEMGTSAIQLIVENWGNSNIAAKIYSLQPTSQCNTYGAGWYDLFVWNPNSNTWSQPRAGSCMTMASTDYKGNLYIVGYDWTNHVTALFQSTNGGQSWALWSDSWAYVNMSSMGSGAGCAITNAHSIYSIDLSQPWSSWPSLPALPAGTAAGCLIVDMTTIGWNTAGNVYVIPAETESQTWQSVTGLLAQTITGGGSRYGIFAEDFSGKPYHWNVNAPGMSAQYGGQWNVGQGCPTPSNPCTQNATHTVSFRTYFTSGHGINGAQGKSTQVFTNNIQVSGRDYNPWCDVSFGNPGDEECIMAVVAGAHCDMSNSEVSNEGDTLTVYEAVDADEFVSWKSSYGPVPIENPAFPEMGTWEGTVTDVIANACPIGLYDDGTSYGTPSCPEQSPATFYFNTPVPYIDQTTKNWWLAQITERMQLNENGVDSPYNFYDTYAIWTFADGSQSAPQCYGDRQDKFRWSAYFLLDPCK